MGVVTVAATPTCRRSRRAVGTVAAGLTVAALGAALGAWVGWMGSPPLLRTVDAQALATELIPGAAVTRTERVEPTFGYEAQGSSSADALLPVLGGDDYRAGYVLVVVQTPGSGGAAIARARQRLESSDWRTGEGPARSGLAAKNGRQYLEIYPSDNYGVQVDGSQDRSRVTVVIQRDEPVRVAVFSVIGWLIGLSVGAGASVGVLRTALGISRSKSTIAGPLGLLLLLPGTLVTTAHLGYRLAALHRPMAPTALWGGYMFWGIKAISIGGLAIGIDVAVINLLWFLANATGVWRDAAPAPMQPGGFKVILEKTEGRELDLIKALRESLDIDYAGAKVMVNNLPSTVC
jgi:hypothetical protein